MTEDRPGALDDAELQAGWTVMSRDGQELGTVMSVTGGDIVIEARQPVGQRLRIPSHYVAERSAKRVAVISLDAREARTAIADV